MTPDISQIADVLHHVRFGTVLAPETLKSQLRPVTQLPSPMANYALAARTPNWLVDKLDSPDARPEHRLVVYPTVDRNDHLLALLLQAGSVQLRWLMQLSDPLVQSLLVDALEERALTMLLSIENTGQMAVMGLDFDLQNPQSLRTYIRNSHPSRHGIEPLVQLTTLYSHAQFGPSLIDGCKVTDTIAVLVGSDTQRQLEAAAMFNPGTQTPGEEDAKIH